MVSISSSRPPASSSALTTSTLPCFTARKRYDGSPSMACMSTDASPCSAIGRTSSLTCATFPFVIASRKMCASSAPLQALLRARQIARHAASCRRRELRLSLASRVSSPKLSKVASMPSPRSTRHTSSPIFESISTQTKFVNSTLLVASSCSSIAL